MKCPAEVHTPSPRPHRGLPELACPFHGQTIHVTCCGRICLHRKKLISARCSPFKPLVSKQSKRVFGWSALWITILATSIWRKNSASSGLPVWPKSVRGLRVSAKHLQQVYTPVSSSEELLEVGYSVLERQCLTELGLSQIDSCLWDSTGAGVRSYSHCSHAAKGSTGRRNRPIHPSR